MWLFLAFISAFLLGLYDVIKKISLNNNAVIPILFLNVLFCCLLFLPVIILSFFFPATIQNSIFYLPPVSGSAHIYLFIKATIVLSSWIFAYFSLKHLPITIASPIKATQPILILLGALILFGERLNGWQWLGITTAILSFYLLSSSGKKERPPRFSTRRPDFLLWSLCPGLNWRPRPYQGRALPTELQRHLHGAGRNLRQRGDSVKRKEKK